MFDNTVELAENKLLLLYIVSKLDFPVSNAQITDLILENNLMNYFTLQQYIDELVTSDFLACGNINGNKLFITEKGKDVLELFIHRIAPDKKEKVDAYLKNNSIIIKSGLEVTADYTVSENNDFIVKLKAVEKEQLLIEIKLSMPSGKQAENLCEKWKNNYFELYKKINEILTEPQN